MGIRIGAELRCPLRQPRRSRVNDALGDSRAAWPRSSIIDGCAAAWGAGTGQSRPTELKARHHDDALRSRSVRLSRGPGDRRVRSRPSASRAALPHRLPSADFTGAATTALRRDAPRAQAASPVPPAKGAGHEEHDRTTPKAYRQPGQDHPHLACPLPRVASAGQHSQVTTDVGARARSLASHHQLCRSSGRGIQAGLPTPRAK